jgi:type IV pilus assembly protein PilB
MIGEIRDTETAQIAVRASITGHLVVSTLHTNNTASSIARLQDMGVEPYLIADSLVGIIAQRLVRRLCDCKKPHLATKVEKYELGINPEEELTIYEPCGCKMCNNTGYLGRIGIYEIMTITPKLKNMITSCATADAIKKAAIEEGMNTLRASAADYVKKGITSVAEMMKATYEVQNGDDADEA